MKRCLCVLAVFVLMPAAAGAIVFDKQKTSGEIIAPGIKASRLNSMKAKINGRDVRIKSFECREPVKKVLEECLLAAEKKGSVTENNPYIWLAANALFKGAAGGIDPDSFGYIFTRDKSGTADFVVAGASGGKTEIIKAEIDGCGAASQGYDDGINHFTGAKKVLSIEFISGNKTINFGNFYIIRNTGSFEIRSYYKEEFERKGFEVINKEYSEETDRYMLKRGSRELVVDIYRQVSGEVTVFVTG